MGEDGLSLSLCSQEGLGMMGKPPHFESRFHGLYGTFDYSFVSNINHTEFNDDYALKGFVCSLGWQWRHQSAVGVGFSYLRDPMGSFSQIPVFLEFRSHYVRRRVTPYTNIEVGWTYPFGSVNNGRNYVKINKGGVEFGVTAGFRIALNRREGIHIGGGYQMLMLNEVERGMNNIAVYKLPCLYHNTRISFGINF